MVFPISCILWEEKQQQMTKTEHRRMGIIFENLSLDTFTPLNNIYFNKEAAFYFTRITQIIHIICREECEISKREIVVIISLCNGKTLVPFNILLFKELIKDHFCTVNVSGCTSMCFLYSDLYQIVNTLYGHNSNR